MDKKFGTIYIVINLVNGKQYVGQTIRTLDDRKKRHFYDVKSHSQSPIHRAIRKYGIKNFKWIPIEYSINELDEMECLWIKNLNSLAPNGYNLDSGGSKNKIVAECVRKRLSENHRPMNGENNHFYNKKHKQSSIIKMKKSRRKYLKNHPEVIQKMSEIMKEKVGNKNFNFSHKWTQEQKDAQSEKLKKYYQKHPNALKGKNNPMFGKIPWNKKVS